MCHGGCVELLQAASGQVNDGYYCSDEDEDGDGEAEE